MSAAVIPTPAGVGAVELIMTNLFAVLVGVHKAGAITVLYRVATFIFPFVVGGVLILISNLWLQFTHHMYSGNDHACMRNYLDA